MSISVQNTTTSPPMQTRKALLWLVFFHLFVIAASNYLVQFSFTIFGILTTWGTLTFPFIFLATDLTVRIFGARPARKIIFMAMFPALLISYVISVIFFQGAFQGFAPLLELNTFVARIALASFAAYVIGQSLDIFVFSKLRDKKQWWIAPSVSSFFGNAIDTFIFFSIAFYLSSDAFMAEHWVDIGMVDFAFKVIFSLFLFVPIYGIILNTLTKKLLR